MEQRVFPVIRTVNLWVVEHIINVFLSVDSENYIVYLEKPMGKKLFNFKYLFTPYVAHI